MGSEASKMDENFSKFMEELEFLPTLELFKKFLSKEGVDASQHKQIYKKIKHVVKTKRKTPWSYIDKRAAQNVYRKGDVCKNTKVLIIGAGPCGLRMAIEAALLGAKVKVVEARESFSRNNVLHLWPFVIQDMKNLGAKVFHPKFCTGCMDHVSIRRLQMILLKIALILGVEVEAPVTFEDLVNPSSGKGWRARLSPNDHPWNNWEFDVIVGADGKRNSLKGFKRKAVIEGRQAIAITANFVNHKTKEEGALEEIGGIFYVYQREFFDSLKRKTGIDLENFVYYKDDTHYFVMTAKKQSLINKGVLKQNTANKSQLLSHNNVDKDKLLSYAREAAQVATKNRIPNMEFALNHKQEQDAAIFDFSTMYMAENSCLVSEHQGCQLLQVIVGDTLIEPFWPTGAGCARGFLSVFDAAWLIRNWVEGEKSVLELISEREGIYQLLAQATPENLKKNINQYTIDPSTRYGNRVKSLSVQPIQIIHLFDTDQPSHKDDLLKKVKSQPSKLKPSRSILKKEVSSEAKQLLVWYQNQLKPYRDKVKVTNLTTSWCNGVALCLILDHFLRDGNIGVSQSSVENLQKAFAVIEEKFNVSCLMSAEDLASNRNIDKAEMFTFLGRLKEALVDFALGLGIDHADLGVGVDEEAQHSTESLVTRLTSIGFTPSIHSQGSLQSLRTNSLEWKGAAAAPSPRVTRSSEDITKPSLLACHNTPIKDRFKAIAGDNKELLNPKVPVSPKPPSPKKSVSPPKPLRVRPDDEEEQADVYLPIPPPSGSGSGSGSANLHPSLDVLRSKGKVKKNRIKFTEGPVTVIPESVAEEEEPVLEENQDGADIWQVPSNPLEKNEEETAIKEPFLPEGEVTVMDPDQEEADAWSVPSTPAQKSPPSGDRDRLSKKLDDLITSTEESSRKMGYAKELCCLCYKRMLLSERRRYLSDPSTGRGFNFHRQCFRCAACRCMLRYGNVLPHKDTSGNISFYCFRHAPSKKNLRRYKTSNKAEDTDEWPDIHGASNMGFGPTSLALYLKDNLEYVDEVAKEADEDMRHDEDEEDSGEFGSEEDEDTSSDENLDDLVLRNQPYASLRSLQLLVAHDLQIQVEEMEQMEREGNGGVAGPSTSQDMNDAKASEPISDDDFLNVLRIKAENRTTNIKANLTQQLDEIEERCKRLRERLESTSDPAELQRIVFKLEQDMSNLENAFGFKK